MSNLAKLEFVALDITGKNFLSWILDAEIHLDANGLGNTIKEKNMETHLVGSSIGDNDMCLVDSASTHTILKDKKFFSFLIMQGSDVNTISSSAKLIEGSGRANILLPGGTKNSY